MLSDGFTSVMSAILSKIGRVMEEGTEKVSIGGVTPRIVIPVVDLGLKSPDKAAIWVKRIGEMKGDDVVVYTDGSMSEEGRVGGGWCSEGGTVKGSICLGRMATVWDGEVAGIWKALEKSPPGWKILVLTDSQAAIAAVVNAEVRGKHSTANMGRLITEVRKSYK